MNEFQADPFMKETLGDHIYEKYVEGKLREWEMCIRDRFKGARSRYGHKNSFGLRGSL